MAKLGINFRATSTYVTDGSGETYSLGETYPTTRGGLTFGWTQDATGSSRDRNSANDRRLAGMIGIINSSATTSTFRIDLPDGPGTYNVWAAFGDASNLQDHWVEFRDNTTVLDTFTSLDTAANSFLDATGTELTAATWDDSGGTPQQFVFATSTFFIELGEGGIAGNSSCIAHIAVEKVSTQSQAPRTMHHFRQQGIS